MRWLKKTAKVLGILLCLPVGYLMVALTTSFITVNSESIQGNSTIFLHSNGVHLDIAISMKDVPSNLVELCQLKAKDKEESAILSFGWGDAGFYEHVQYWEDVKFKYVWKAMFAPSPSLIHLTRYSSPKEHWCQIHVTSEQLSQLCTYISAQFETLEEDIQNNPDFTSGTSSKTIVAPFAYGKDDKFFKSKGSYHCFNTCNSWINLALKQSGIKACWWTPFDFRLLKLHSHENH